MKDPLAYRLGRLIGDARRGRGMTQGQAAAAMGYSTRYRGGVHAVASIERGDHEPHISTLARTARALGYEVHVCLREPGGPCSDRFQITA